VIPAGVPQLIHSFVAYARSHPGELKGNTAVVVGKSPAGAAQRPAP
jgi:hypothetical protein